MRLFPRPRRHHRTPAPLCLAAAAALLSAPVPAHAAATPVPSPVVTLAPSCAAPDSRAFPLTTRIHGGPVAYAAGGGYATWYVDLTNTTDRPCAGIHPVVVLVDEKRTLKPSQARLEFYDGTRAEPHPVRFVATDRDELVGAFDDGFPGFTVGPQGTVRVKVRLAFTPDARPNRVTATAAVVQRREDDGDWVGQSNDYRFGIGTAPDETPAPEGDPKTSPAAEPDASPSPGLPDTTPFPGRPDELAATGPALLAHGALAVALLLLAGTALYRARVRRA
ncbi:hypothetical protein [Streptomyces sp. JB150]|uniref:hypothetical protein n=1 Tax=Streptomyces sp. JB150 TaxID=2714844 RepID=UPI0014072856|nr:hypothetical protein [Streptomyces sp. JB150]QIJ62865.1 hypothetical protein G7Z13_13070 [Streptomyces sp. JB150]